VTSGGLYTAGPTGGTFQLVAREPITGEADTAAVSVSAGLPATGTGLPFGAYHLWSSYTTMASGPWPMTMSENYTDPAGIVTQIAAARSMKQKLVLVMTGGPHELNLTNGKFDLAKWKARMDRFSTAAIQSAVAAGVADGTIIGNSVMDEPEHDSWGGVMTKPLLDQMAAYVKAIFPTLPVGVDHMTMYPEWRSTERYQVMDYVWTPPLYWYTLGNIPAWRDKVLAQAALDHVTVLFGLNVMDGGIHVYDGGWTCPLTTTGGQGTFQPACKMTLTQVRDWGLALAPYGCGLLMWKYNTDFFARSENQQAFNDIAADLARRSAKSCRRLG
jgi:hypothetical protein